MKQTDSLKRIDMPNENKINDYADCENQMYSLKNELTILRDFVKQEYTGTKRCYSEEEIQAVERRLHFKLPAPIRTLYIMMGDLLINSYQLRPLELLRWDNNCLGFFASPESDVILGICDSDAPNSLYYWSENDIEGESCVFEDDFDACNEVGDEDGKKKAVQAYLQYWGEVESSNIVPYKMMKSPRFCNSLDAYCLYLAIHSLCEWAEIIAQESNSYSFYFRSETLHSDSAYLQEKARDILQIFKPLSSHTELLEMNTHILMAYVSKDLKSLLVLLDGDIALTLLTANPAGTDTLREIEKNIKLSFDHY